MSVVIFGDTAEFEEHGLVRDAVEERGATTHVVPVQEWPGGGPVEFSVEPGRCVFGDSVPLEEVTGVFSMVQSVFPPFSFEYDWFDEKPDRTAYRQLMEWQRLFRPMLDVFEEHGARVPVSSAEWYWNHHRPWMLERYRHHGLPVPETTFTSDPDRVLEFVETHGRTIVQGVNGGGRPELTGPEDLSSERLAKLSEAPIKLQEYVPGTDTRAYVVDGAFAGMIRYDYDSDAYSFKSPDVDYDDLDSDGISPSPELRDAVVRAGELSPSAFTVVDVRLQDDGSFTILESNTPGRFAGHDASGITEVSDHLAAYLVGA